MTNKANEMKIKTHYLYKSKTSPVEDEYTILFKIGSGAYGHVYKVIHKLSKTLRAMKVINRFQVKKFFNNNNNKINNKPIVDNYDRFMSDGYNALFEGDYLKKLDHPNIVKMYDSYVTPESFYLILEYINGGELYDTIIGFKNFTEKIASKVMYQLISAVAYLHDKNLVHRDIKPENLLVEASEFINKLNKQLSAKSQKSKLVYDSSKVNSNKNINISKDIIDEEKNEINEEKNESNLNLKHTYSLAETIKNESINCFIKRDEIDFNIVLIDFGACTYLEKGMKLSMKFGTPYYLAPEVLNQNYDFKCDIWSCGIIMHTLLIGHPPFLGANNKEILKKVEEGKVNMEGPKWSKISNEAKLLLKKMLEYNQTKRISAKEVLENKWITCWRSDKCDSKFEQTILNDILNNIKSFRAIEKFQQASLAYIVHITNSSSQNHELRKIFKSFDTNGDGKLSYLEFRIGYKKVFGEFIKDEDIMEIINKMDQNKDEYIEYEEFLRISLNHQKLVNEQNLKQAFENFDVDKNGSLSKDEIRQILKDADEEYLDELFMIIDLDRNGMISFDEFKRMMEILIKENSIVIP